MLITHLWMLFPLLLCELYLGFQIAIGRDSFGAVVSFLYTGNFAIYLFSLVQVIHTEVIHTFRRMKVKITRKHNVGGRWIPFTVIP